MQAVGRGALMLRGCGHIDDDPEDLIASPPRNAVHLVGGNAIAHEAALWMYVDHVRDQGDSSSCVGQTIGSMIDIRGRADGLTLPAVSRLAVYGLRPDTEADEGSRPRDILRNCALYGVVAEKRWPFDMSHVKGRLPWDVAQHGADAKVKEYYRITAEGDDRAYQVQQALSAGHPVGYATTVDAAFDDYETGVLGAPRGAGRGQHYTCITGYDASGFHALNSWGDAWGEGHIIADGQYSRGFYRFDRARLAAGTDLYVITVAPPGVT